ncbi:hypothetical protein BT69DRAFT_35306 [Atractiella rhizophila]|nr:hypothetical protein BT69DRAFT_35306 [Atractiella rhizophila]
MTQTGREDGRSNTRLERYLVDYAFREGHQNVAELISKTYNIEEYVDASLWKELHAIQHALESATPSAAAALQWCKENSQALKKAKSTLELSLRLQEFVELCRVSSHPEALEYFQKWLQPYLTVATSTPVPNDTADWDAQTLAWMRDTIIATAGLLTYSPRTRIGKYQKMYEPSRWFTLSTYFRTVYLSLLSLPPLPLLSLALSAGLACLKTTSCLPARQSTASHSTSPTSHLHPPSRRTPDLLDLIAAPSPSSTATVFPSSPLSHSHHEPPLPPSLPPSLESLVMHPQRSCPLCYSPLSQLADEVPRGHWATSSIVCGISGKVIAGGEELRVLPNGRVYSREALKRMAERYGGRVVCPKTGEEFEEREGRKVFIS